MLHNKVLLFRKRTLFYCILFSLFSNLGYAQFGCYSGHAKWTSKDPQGYARMFFKAYCDCKAGAQNAQHAQQLVATMRSMHQTWKDFMTNDPSLPSPLVRCAISGGAGGGANASGGNNALSEQQKMQQSIANMRKGLNMVNRAQARAQQLSNELNQLENIVNSGNPFQIQQQFNNVMNRIEQLDANLSAAINQQYVEDGVSILSDYSSGNSEGVVYGSLGALGSLAENAEAKEQLKKKRAEAIRQRNRAFDDAANQIIRANNDALQKYIASASVVLEPDREAFYMNKAFYHSCYARSVSNNFNYNNADWAIDRCKNVDEPIFKRYYAPLHEQHFDAAQRKIELYRKYGNKELYEGAIQHMGSAIDIKPKNANYYLSLGRIAGEEDLVLSLTNYVAAYELNPDLFTDELKKEFNQTVEKASAEASKPIYTGGDLARLNDYLDADLYDLLEVDGQSLLEVASVKNNLNAVTLLYEHQVEPLSNTYSQQLVLQKNMALAAKSNSKACLAYYLNKGGNADETVKGKTLLQYAEIGDAPQTFLLLWNNSNKQTQNERLYNQKPIYVKALSEAYPAKAANGLCNMPSDLRYNTSAEMLDAALNNPAYLTTLSTCSKVKELLKQDPALQQKVQSLFALSIMQKSTALASQTNNLTAENIEAAISLYQQQGNNALANQLKQALSTYQDVPATPNVSSNPKKQYALSKLLLEEELLASTYLQKEAELITERLINQNVTEVFSVWKSTGYLPTTSKEGQPLSYSFLSSGSNILQAGLANTIDFNQTDSRGANVLHSLAFVSSSPNAYYLITKSGANVNAKGPYDWTPLHYAVRENNVQLVKLLLAAGADTKAKDKWGRTPKSIAKERDFDEIKSLL